MRRLNGTSRFTVVQTGLLLLLKLFCVSKHELECRDVVNGYDKGGGKHGKSRLVTMSRCGKYSRQGERRVVFKDTRMPVATVFENLEAGLSVEEVMEEFAVIREQINSVLHFAAKSLGASPSAAVLASAPADAHSV